MPWVSRYVGHIIISIIISHAMACHAMPRPPTHHGSISSAHQCCAIETGSMRVLPAPSTHTEMSAMPLASCLACQAKPTAKVNVWREKQCAPSSSSRMTAVPMVSSHARQHEQVAKH